MIKKAHFFILFIVVAQPFPCFAQQDFFLNISNSRSRAVAMGGAVTAVEDDLGAVSYNPAAFDLHVDRSAVRFSVHINPVLPVVSFRQKENFDLSGKSGSDSVLGSLQYLFKSVTLSVSILELGFLFNEEKFFKKRSNKFFNSDLFRDNLYHSAIARIKLSSQVSLGIAGSLIRTTVNDTLTEGSSISYGILVKPTNKYQVGIMFYDVSDELQDFRRRFDRFADESINAGLAFFPWRNVSLTVDVRNLTESSKSGRFGLQEFHFGYEIANIRHISLRGGYYREKNLSDNYTNIFSAGVGLIDLNRFRSLNNRYNHPTPLVSYTILFENTPDEHLRWHLLTIGFRI